MVKPETDFQSSVALDDGFVLPLSPEELFSALLSPLPDFSLLVERPCPEGER